MNNSPFIKTPRQKRAVKALLEATRIPIIDFGPIVGALNPRQIAMELRRQGWQGIILTIRYLVKDRDGKPCNPGAYYIPEVLKPLAREALEKYTTPAKGFAKVVKGTKQIQNNDIGEV